MTAPGIYGDMPESTYHADPALSASGAKKLLPPSCPALFKWERDHGQQPKRAFDFGHAAHAQVLGVGTDVVTVHAPDWRTKTAKEQAETIRAEGKVPLLVHEVRQVVQMADALRQHPIASVLLDWKYGKPEQSAFWRDEPNGVDCRARFDWLPDTDGGRLIIPDYKTAVSAEPGAIGRAVANFGYAMQSEWYRDAAHALELAEDIAFVFIFQMKEPPYLVTVAELDEQWAHIGRVKNDRARQVFRDCTDNDTWPGFADDVELISPPRWALYEMDAA